MGGREEERERKRGRRSKREREREREKETLEVIASMDDAVSIEDVRHDDEIELAPARVFQPVQPKKPA